MGRPMNNDSAKRWWECGRHVCAKRSPLRAQRCAASRHHARGCACAARHVLVRGRCCASKRARAFTQSCRASIVPRTATTRRHARPLARRRCSEPRSRSQPVGRHASAVSSEGALRLRGRAGSMACASEFKPCGLLAQQCAPHRESHGREVKVSECQCVRVRS